MNWLVKLRFRANVAYRVTRQAMDERGVVTGEPVATPYCPERFLTLLCLEDEEGRVFQIGGDAIDLEAKLPPNTGSGLRVVKLGEFFAERGPGRFVEDTLADRRYESEPFEIIGDFKPWDLCFQYWSVPDADGKMRMFIDCDRIEYRHQTLKMKVASKGYKALPDKEWRRVR